MLHCNFKPVHQKKQKNKAVFSPTAENKDKELFSIPYLAQINWASSASSVLWKAEMQHTLTLLYISWERTF